MDAKTVFGYVMLMRVQAYLRSVADENSAYLVGELRYQGFACAVSYEDLLLMQQMEERLNSGVCERYTRATPWVEYEELRRFRDLRLAMDARFNAPEVLQ